MSFALAPQNVIIRMGKLVVDDGSAVTDIGLVADVLVEFDEIKVASPLGDRTTGYDVRLKGSMKQSAKADTSAVNDTVQAYLEQIICVSEDSMVVLKGCHMNAKPTMDFNGGESKIEISSHQIMAPAAAEAVHIQPNQMDAAVVVLDYDAQANPINLDFN